MEARGIFKDASFPGNGKMLITFEVDGSCAKHLSNIVAADDLDIEAVRHREKRSLTANAYMWVLADKIAKAIGSDKDTVYLLELKRYGKFTDILIKPQAVEDLKKSYRLIEELPAANDEYVHVRCYYGSSTYNTLEMAGLIDGIVMDAEELGIETMPPDELAKLKAAWEGYGEQG